MKTLMLIALAVLINPVASYAKASKIDCLDTGFSNSRDILASLPQEWMKGTVVREASRVVQRNVQRVEPKAIYQVAAAKGVGGFGKLIGRGIASWYPPTGKPTANGERYNNADANDPTDLTAAHPSLPFGTRVMVVNKSNGATACVRINDRGPFAHGRVIDLSPAAKNKIGMGGLTRVELYKVAKCPR